MNGVGGLSSPGHHEPDFTTLVKKLVRRYYRDLMLRVPPRLRFILPVVMLMILFAAGVWKRGSSKRDVSSLLSPSTSQCKCPVYGDVAYLQNQLGRARTVFKARMDGPTKDSKLMIFTADDIFRGPPRLGDFRVALPVKSIKYCSPLGVPNDSRHEDDDNSEKDVFLIAADLVSGASILQKDEAEDTEKSILFGVANNLECGGVLLIRWDALAWEVIDALTNEGALMETWWRVDELKERNRTLRLVESEWWIRNGTSLVATCRDQHTSMLEALRNWLQLDGVDEIVLVDWSSKVSVVDTISSRAPEFLRNRKLQIVTVAGQTTWSESMASNVGIRMCTRNLVLRVDCDTLVPNDFVKKHPLNGPVIYRAPTSVDNFLVRNKTLQGLVFARRIDLLAVNGYDERINSFGYADQDLSDRIEKKRMVNTLLLDDSHFQVAGHGDDDEDVRVFTVLKRGESFSEEVEAIRNRFLLSKFPPWDMGSRNVLFNAKVKLTQLPDADDGSLGRIRTYELTRANLPATFQELADEGTIEEASLRALKSVLYKLGAATLATKNYSKEFFGKLISYLAEPEKHSTLLIRLKGGCAARLLSYASLQAALSLRNLTSDPPTQDRWLWEKGDKNPECGCKFTSLFFRGDSEIYDKGSTKIGGEQVFPDDNTSEVLTSWASVRDLKLEANRTFPLEVKCLQPDRSDLDAVAAVRRKLEGMIPALDDGRSRQSGEKTTTTARDFEPTVAVDRNFLKLWQGGMNGATYEKYFNRLLGKDTSIHEDATFRAHLLDGCGDTDSVQATLTTYPELAAIFAALWSSSSRCLGTSIR